MFMLEAVLVFFNFILLMNFDAFFLKYIREHFYDFSNLYTEGIYFILDNKDCNFVRCDENKISYKKYTIYIRKADLRGRSDDLIPDYEAKINSGGKNVKIKVGNKKKVFIGS